MGIEGATARTQPALVLITHHFPYGHGEEFLETEITYLSDEFREIRVAPLHVSGTSRPVPDNVRVDTALARALNPKRRSSRYVRALGEGALWRELFGPRVRLQPHRARKAWADMAAAMPVRDWLLAIAGADEPRSLLVYTYWLDAATVGAGLAREREPGFGLVSRAHGGDLYEEAQDPPYLPYRNRLASWVDMLYPVSTHGREYLLERFPFSPERCRVSRLGVEDPKVAVRRSPAESLHVVSCSHIRPNKRVPLVARAIVELARSCPERPIQWTHIGDGPERPEVDREMELAPENVSWNVTGLLSNQEVLAVYRRQAVDVFVNVSTSEGIAVSIMEAQSCGIPVVATAVGGTPEIVSRANGALLSPRPSPTEIAEAIRSVAGDAESWAARSAAARKTWDEQYNARSNYIRFAAELHRTAGR